MWYISTSYGSLGEKNLVFLVNFCFVEKVFCTHLRTVYVPDTRNGAVCNWYHTLEGVAVVDHKETIQFLVSLHAIKIDRESSYFSFLNFGTVLQSDVTSKAEEKNMFRYRRFASTLLMCKANWLNRNGGCASRLNRLSSSESLIFKIFHWKLGLNITPQRCFSTLWLSIHWKLAQ